MKFCIVSIFKVHGRLARWIKWRACDVGEAKEWLGNELWISVTSPTSQLILQPFRRFTYVTAHSPTLPLLHLLDSHSPTLLSLLLRHRLFTYVTWRAAHAIWTYGHVPFCYAAPQIAEILVAFLKDASCEINKPFVFPNEGNKSHFPLIFTNPGLPYCAECANVAC